MRIDRAGPTALGLLLLALAVPPASARAQQPQPRAGVQFASFDVGIGAVVPEDASAGLSYGVGFDLANFPLRGGSTRLGFRFWSATDEAAGVDVDDGLLELLAKAHLGKGRVRGYAGLGLGLHFFSARLAEMPEVKDGRDGFRPGLEVLLGAETAVGRDRFLAAFVEARGSVVSRPRHAIAQAGLRVRFDRLGGR